MVTKEATRIHCIELDIILSEHFKERFHHRSSVLPKNLEEFMQKAIARATRIESHETGRHISSFLRHKCVPATYFWDRATNMIFVMAPGPQGENVITTCYRANESDWLQGWRKRNEDPPFKQDAQTKVLRRRN